MIEQYITGFAFFVTAMVFHELGHFIAAHRRGLHPQIIFTGKELVTEWEFTPKISSLSHIYLFGIVFGFLPLFIGLFIAPHSFIFIPLYIVGIVSDIKKIRELQ